MPAAMKKTKKPASKPEKGVIPLKDLVPRKDPKGGKGPPGSVFGAGSGIAESGKAPPTRPKDPRKR
jgi:hypothetical protein